MSGSANVAITTVLSILACIDIVGNTLVCLIIKRNRDMRTTINYLLMNLAIADIIYAVFIIPRIYYQLRFAHHPDGVIGTILCKLVTGGFIAWTGSAFSIVNLVFITIERYNAVINPHGNKWNFLNRKLKVIIPATWGFALIFDLPILLVDEVVKTKSGNSCVELWPEGWMGKAYMVTWLVGTFLPLILMIGLYSRVVCALWFKRNDNGQVTQQQKGVVRVRKRVTLMVVTVTAIFGICWGTGELVYFLLYFISEDVGATLLAIADVMILFNSAVNPFVYALLNQQFREKMKGMLCCNGSSAPAVHSTPEPLDIELAERTTE
ncbi:hypothetical protein ACROYT_G038842 [Oculina patagonica]